MKQKKYLEKNITIDGSPYNRLQVYKIVKRNYTVSNQLEDSKNNMEEGRPCIVVQEGEIGKFYGSTKLIILPLTKVKYERDESGNLKMINGRPVKRIKSYTIDFLNAFVVEVMAESLSDCLVYNYATRIESELKKWYTKYKEEIFISVEDKIKILRTLEEYFMETVKIETKAFGRKTVYEEVKESNRKLRESYESLELSYEEVKESNRELRESNKSLELSYEEVKESNRELRESMDRLIKIVEDKLG